MAYPTDVDLKMMNMSRAHYNEVNGPAKLSPGSTNAQGLRYDEGKPRYDLIPPDGLEELAIVFTKGAEKYADRNWELGMKWSKCFAPMMRHAWKFWRGEWLDQESGRPHMAHVVWNAMALLVYGMRKIGQDDRNVLELAPLSQGNQASLDALYPPTSPDIREFSDNSPF